MRTVSSLDSVRTTLKDVQNTARIGFVPTMGALHEGHLSLMRKAKEECDFLVVSLFVNPLQFGPSEDLAVYPRTLSLDRKKAKSVGVDLFWTPSESTLYPPGFQTTVEVDEISHLWEGASRPGHFKGVCTIVAKLLLIVQPDRLYLGQKDYQQACVIQRMIQDLHFKTRLRLCPTQREKDGLAMSSRNVLFSAREREIAPRLYQALRAAKVTVRDGERRAKFIIKTVKTHLESAPEIRIDYVALCDTKTLQPIQDLSSRGVLLTAIHLGTVRLIDNIILSISQK